MSTIFQFWEPPSSVYEPVGTEVGYVVGLLVPEPVGAAVGYMVVGAAVGYIVYSEPE
jgi:hypothetical protein